MTRPSATGAAPATLDAVCVEITDMPGTHNYWCPTARKARALAMEHARGLGPGWTVDHEARPRPHFHVVQLLRRPDGRVQHRRVSGHFFYGGRYPYRIRHRDAGRGLHGELRVGRGSRQARSASGSAPAPVASELSYGPSAPATSSSVEDAIVRAEIARGVTDENALTDLVFNRRYPARNRRPLSPSEPGFRTLSQEWLRIRDTQVRPMLGRPVGSPAPAPAPPAAAPTGKPTPTSTPYSLWAPHVRLVVHEVVGRFSVPTVYTRLDHSPTQQLAADFMVYDNRARGDAVAHFLIDNAARLRVEYVIWLQRIWYIGRDRAWRGMADRGSPTANHMDHVHVSFRP